MSSFGIYDECKKCWCPLCSKRSNGCAPCMDCEREAKIECSDFKRFKEKRYTPENSLPNFRMIESDCCFKCKEAEFGYEGEIDCKILLELKRKKENLDKNIWVYTDISPIDLCDDYKERK